MVAVSGIGKQIQIIIFPSVMTGRWQHIADIDWTLLSVSHTILYTKTSPSQPPIPILILIRAREGEQHLMLFPLKSKREV